MDRWPARWQHLSEAVAREWRVGGFGLVLAVLALRAGSEPLSAVALAAWVLAGAVAIGLDALVGLERRRRIARHDACGLRSLAGWRLRDDAALDGDTQRLIELLVHLHETAQMVPKPIRGHPNHAYRLSYRHPLRELARRWAASRALPVRSADRMLHDLARMGLLRQERICNTLAWRLAQATAPDALRELEARSPRPLIEWRLGRDPRAER